MIRSKTDQGIVAVLDPRIVTKWYGRKFLEAIPNCEIVREVNGAERFGDL